MSASVPAQAPLPVNWDFRSSQPLSTGLYGKCQYDYNANGYVITVAENGSTCLDGASTPFPAGIRVSTTAMPLSGSAGYTYGIRFGQTADTVPNYYGFEVSTNGNYKLVHLANHVWTDLLAWRSGSGINAAGPNVLAVEVRGQTVKLLVNGVPQADYQASSPIAGKAGFGIFGYGDDPPYPVVAFTGFKVELLDVPPPATGNDPVDYDFRSSQPLSSGRFGKCQYDYGSGGYTITVEENGSTCVDGPAGVRPAALRLSTTAVGVAGSSGYNYGLRFGYSSDSTAGYYAFAITTDGSFQFSRYRNGRWQALIPWTPNGAINTLAGSANTLEAEIRGTQVGLYINNVRVGSYTVESPPIGLAGFGIIGYGEGYPLPSVTFTRFSITPL